MTDEDEDAIQYVADIVEALIDRGMSSDEHIAAIAGHDGVRPSKEEMLDITCERRFTDAILPFIRAALEEAWDDSEEK